MRIFEGSVVFCTCLQFFSHFSCEKGLAVELSCVVNAEKDFITVSTFMFSFLGLSYLDRCC